MADEWTKTKLFRIVLRIATVVFSIWSWIKTTNASQTMQDGTTITSSSDYPSFQYSSVSELVSAVLQGVAISLELVGHNKCSKFVEMLDKVILALMTTSTALLFAVDEITSCEPGRRSVSSQARKFSGGIQEASHLSLVATFSASFAAYTMRAPAALTLAGKLLRRLICPGDGPNIIHGDGGGGGGGGDDPPRPGPSDNNGKKSDNPEPSNNGKKSDNPEPSSNNGNNSDKPDPKQPNSKKGKKIDNLELLITAPPGPSHYYPNSYYPIGLGFGVSWRCEDEDAEAGCSDRFSTY